jgi:hypothetical protein
MKGVYVTAEQFPVFGENFVGETDEFADCHLIELVAECATRNQTPHLIMSGNWLGLLIWSRMMRFFPCSSADISPQYFSLCSAAQETQSSQVNDYLTNKDNELHHSNKHQQASAHSECAGKVYELPLYLCILIALGCGGFVLWRFSLVISNDGCIPSGARGLAGSILILLGFILLLTDLGTFAFGSPLAFWSFRWLLGEQPSGTEGNDPNLQFLGAKEGVR